MFGEPLRLILADGRVDDFPFDFSLLVSGGGAPVYLDEFRNVVHVEGRVWFWHACVTPYEPQKCKFKDKSRRGSILREVARAALIGFAISTIGADPIMGRPRFDMGWELLAAGLPFLVVLIGIFAISQLASEVEDADAIKRGEKLVDGEIEFETWSVMREVLMRPVNLIRSSMVGVAIGALPGAGGSIANLVAYDQAKRASKSPEEFGKGTPDGVVASDLVVSNANPAYTERQLLPDAATDHAPGYWDDQTYAPSAYMLYLGVEGELPGLDHHTLLLPTDWSDHFESIFEAPAWPDDPSMYLCVPSKTDDTVAPDGHHTVVVLVPIAPGLDDGPAERGPFREEVLEGIAAYTDVDLRDRIVVEESFCVSGFAERYNSYEGSALGMAHTLTQTALFRPNHRYPGVDGLYAVGASTNPGISFLMVPISDEIDEQKIITDTT